MIIEVLTIALAIFLGLLLPALSIWFFITEKDWLMRIVIIILSPWAFWLMPLFVVEIIKRLLFRFGL